MEVEPTEASQEATFFEEEPPTQKVGFSYISTIETCAGASLFGFWSTLRRKKLTLPTIPPTISLTPEALGSLPDATHRTNGEHSEASAIASSLSSEEAIQAPPSPIRSIEEESKSVEIDPFLCTDEDQSNIRNLIVQMATSNPIALALNSAKLRDLGGAIKPLHPLLFLKVLLSDETLKGHVQSLQKRSIKKMWHSFLNGENDDGLIQNLQNYHRQGELVPYIDNFAARIGKNSIEIRNFINGNQIDERFIKFLFDLN